MTLVPIKLFLPLPLIVITAQQPMSCCDFDHFQLPVLLPPRQFWASDKQLACSWTVGEIFWERERERARERMSDLITQQQPLWEIYILTQKFAIFRELWEWVEFVASASANANSWVLINRWPGISSNRDRLRKSLLLLQVMASWRVSRSFAWLLSCDLFEREWNCRIRKLFYTCFTWFI